MCGTERLRGARLAGVILRISVSTGSGSDLIKSKGAMTFNALAPLAFKASQLTFRVLSSKDHARGELYVARTSAAQKRIADSNVRRDNDRKKINPAPSYRINAVEAGVRGEAR